MSEQTLKAMKELDEAAERAGGFLAPLGSQDTHYNYRKLIEYCREKNIEPLDLTIRELRTFIITT